MSAVPVLQALFWPGDSPVSPCGETDFPELAQGLANADYRGVPRGPFAPRRQRDPRQGKDAHQGLGVRQHYSCAQHAVVVSRAMETLAVLNLRERRVLATHAWLAEVREAELAGDADVEGARKRLALRFLQIEALADVLAPTLRWDGRPAGASAAVQGAQDVDRLLIFLARMPVPERNRLALHALFSELIPAGIGMSATEAALNASGLAREVPAEWVEILRFARRTADEAVRRDLPRKPGGERTGFPALAAKIVPLDESAAARLWLERHRVLSEAGSQTAREPETGETS